MGQAGYSFTSIGRVHLGGYHNRFDASLSTCLSYCPGDGGLPGSLTLFSTFEAWDPYGERVAQKPRRRRCVACPAGRKWSSEVESNHRSSLRRAVSFPLNDLRMVGYRGVEPLSSGLKGLHPSPLDEYPNAQLGSLYACRHSPYRGIVRLRCWGTDARRFQRWSYATVTLRAVRGTSSHCSLNCVANGAQPWYRSTFSCSSGRRYHLIS